MKVTFLVPGIHHRPTGGNIYNRRIITEMQRHGAVEVATWSPESKSGTTVDPADTGVIVVDSLLVREKDPLRALRRADPSATLVLLAHYLHCIDPNEQNTRDAEIERTCLPLFDGIVTTSRYAQRALTDADVPDRRIAVVPPGLDDAYRVPLPERSDRERASLLTVANLLPGKGLHALVDALERLAAESWAWTLVGDDTLDTDFAELLYGRIQDSPMATRVTCTGAVPTDELRARYDDADLFVLPSRFETCSMATREAMARGLPVVGREVGGLPENLGDAPAGRLVPPGAPDALADALRALLTDPAARTRMGGAARKRSEVFPTWGEAGDRFYGAVQALHTREW